MVWLALGSALDDPATPANVNAPVVAPVYLLDGLTKVANGATDIWDGTIASPINIDQNGAAVAGDVHVWTGSSASGGSMRPLGKLDNYVQCGLTSASDGTWISLGEQQGGLNRMYALSIPLVHPGGTLSRYQTWALANGASIDPVADSNNNGIPNGVEYFMGGTGKNPAVLPLIVNNNGTLTWTIPYDPNAAATYKFQVSDDLSLWEDILPADPEVAVLTSPDRIQLTVPPGQGRQFCRLVVTVNP
jgi:hypothetical protein